MEKQIEKQAIEGMAKDLAETIAWDDDEIPTVDCLETAARLFCKSYRKQSVGEKTKWCEYCKGRAYTKKPLTVITRYGRRIELVFEFCPNCGRKMKEGAE